MYTIYRGPSQLDGKPIGHYLTGIENTTRNVKTGPLLQTWCIRDDINPLEALKTGEDESICGSCPLRGTAGKQRSCYVTVHQAPNQVYRHREASKDFIPRVVKNHAIRFGAYGDPAAAPVDSLADIAHYALRWTGYTHQWRDCDPAFSKYLMASCDSAADYELAKSMGWRTFRVKTPEEQRMPGESMCPASDEAGKRETCFSCGRCNGTTGRSKDVVINVHGSGKKSFLLLPER